jgi:hypothetical protein
MKKLILFFLLAFSLSATTSELLEKNNKLLSVQRDLILKQQETIDNISKCLEADLKYHQERYSVTVTCDVENFAIDSNFKIVKDESTKISKTFDFYFQREVAKRPYEVIPGIFKLGGLLYYSQDSKQVTPDILLTVEIFSFDKILPLYGLSLNAGAGVRVFSVQLGYQLLYTKMFSNTNIMIGYSYSYVDRDFNPTIGIALNF